MTQIERTLVTAALLGLLALMPTRAFAATLVPFRATVFEHYTLSLCAPATVCITAHATGQATQLGDVTEDASVRVDINPADAVNGCSPETRITVLTAANGDEITMKGTGLPICVPGKSATDAYIVAGGTGRFQGATGTGTDSVVFMLSGPGVGVATTTFSGYLSSPGSRHLANQSALGR